VRGGFQGVSAAQILSLLGRNPNGRVCPQNQEDCRSAAGSELVATESELMRRIAATVAYLNAHQHRVPALLGLMEAQLQDPPVKGMRKLDQVAADLGKLGFQGVRGA